MRARAQYSYDSGGRLTSLLHYWDTINAGGTAYTWHQIAENDCGYELTGSNRGLKTSNYFALENAAKTGYDSHTETYGYDASLDHLTNVNYGDGVTETYGYDAAGNRTDSTVDNLNRPTVCNTWACTSDILGNRLTKAKTDYHATTNGTPLTDS